MGSFHSDALRGHGSRHVQAEIWQRPVVSEPLVTTRLFNCTASPFPPLPSPPLPSPHHITPWDGLAGVACRSFWVPCCSSSALSVWWEELPRTSCCSSGEKKEGRGGIVWGGWGGGVEQMGAYAYALCRVVWWLGSAGRISSINIPDDSCAAKGTVPLRRPVNPDGALIPLPLLPVGSHSQVLRPLLRHGRPHALPRMLLLHLCGRRGGRRARQEGAVQGSGLRAKEYEGRKPLQFFHFSAFCLPHSSLLNLCVSSLQVPVVTH